MKGAFLPAAVIKKKSFFYNLILSQQFLFQNSFENTCSGIVRFTYLCRGHSLSIAVEDSNVYYIICLQSYSGICWLLPLLTIDQDTYSVANLVPFKIGTLNHTIKLLMPLFYALNQTRGFKIRHLLSLFPK